jgi:hypothetical protein
MFLRADLWLKKQIDLWQLWVVLILVERERDNFVVRVFFQLQNTLNL